MLAYTGIIQLPVTILFLHTSDPVLDVPLNPSHRYDIHFILLMYTLLVVFSSLKLLPNPSDGSLYSLGSNGDQFEVEKYFYIPYSLI